MALFRPPTLRTAAGALLDKSLLTRSIPIAAVRLPDNRIISRFRSQLEKSQELLRLERVSSVRSDPDVALAAKGGKCLLLNPELKPDGTQRFKVLGRRA